LNVFARLGPLAYRHRWPILMFWAVVLVTAALFAPKLGGQLKGGGFEGSGRDSELAKDLMVEEFGLPRANLVVVFEGEDLSARSEEYQRAEDEALEPLRDMEQIRSVTTYADTKDQRFLSEDGNKTYALVGFDVSVGETQSLVDEVRRKVRSDELTTYVTGPSAVYLDITNASAEDIRRAEKYAFPLALVILVIAFGTLVAAGIPILIGARYRLRALRREPFPRGARELPDSGGGVQNGRNGRKVHLLLRAGGFDRAFGIALFPVYVYPLYRGRRRRRGVRVGLRSVDAAASGIGRPRTQGERAGGA
jgi:hypothetical protein